MLISAIPSRIHDPKKPGDLVKVGGDPLDDAMDAARYGLYSFVTASEKPRELEHMEEMRRLAQQGDLTSSLIRHLQRKAEEEYDGQAIRLARRGGMFPRYGR